MGMIWDLSLGFVVGFHTGITGTLVGGLDDSFARVTGLDQSYVAYVCIKECSSGQ